MLRPGGYAILVDPEQSKAAESDSFTCFHCSKIVFCHELPNMPKPDLGGFCRLCMKHICGKCADNGICDPFEKQLERMEQRDRFRKSIG